MRDLTEVELLRLKEFTKYNVEFALIEPTLTGLKKSILDATEPVRLYLKKLNVHDYENQEQGQENKILIDAILLENTTNGSIHAKASLYRPNTKAGDPRIWFAGLKNYARPNDIIAIIALDRIFYLINITRIDLTFSLSNSESYIRHILDSAKKVTNKHALELLNKLKEIGKLGPIPGDLEADTSIGRTLERLLEIPINSSKQPDYKGIEIKSSRENKKNRKNLFAQVPNWKASKLKSSEEVLSKYGYARGDVYKLYCTVSTQKTNPQGLGLNLDLDNARLYEFFYDKDDYFVVWDLEMLHKRLLEKHNETFWIEAKSIKIGGKEHFEFVSVVHTKKPILAQFDILLQQGFITLDHLIKRDNKGKVVEKGPLFKITKQAINSLFPPSVRYDLKAE